MKGLLACFGEPKSDEIHCHIRQTELSFLKVAIIFVDLESLSCYLVGSLNEDDGFCFNC